MRRSPASRFATLLSISFSVLLPTILLLSAEACRTARHDSTSSPDAASQPAGAPRFSASELVDVIASPTTLALNRVKFFDGEAGWIAGRGGTLLATTDGGRKWIPQPAGIDENLIDLDFVDRENGWAISSHILIHTADGGKSWNQIWDTSTIEGVIEKPERDLPYEAILLRVSFVTRTRGWAIGLGWDPLTQRYRIPLMLATRDGGTVWQWQSVDDEFAAIRAIDQRRCVIAGKFGKIAETSDGGQTWVMRNSLTDDDFLGLFFLDAERGWAIGAQGSIVATRDGGKTWSVSFSLRNSDRALELRAVRFATDLVGVAAGFENRGTTEHPEYLLVALSTYDGGQTWNRKEITRLSFVPIGLALIAQDTGCLSGSGGEIVRFRIPA